MGYKTTDYAEKEKLEKEGHTVIALRGIPFSGPEYEFDFDVEEKKDNSFPEGIERHGEKIKEEKKEIAEPPKRRGNPNWFNRGKK